jgi:hypothetical protein
LVPKVAALATSGVSAALLIYLLVSELLEGEVTDRFEVWLDPLTLACALVLAIGALLAGVQASEAGARARLIDKPSSQDRRPMTTLLASWIAAAALGGAALVVDAEDATQPTSGTAASSGPSAVAPSSSPGGGIAKTDEGGEITKSTPVSVEFIDQSERSAAASPGGCIPAADDRAIAVGGTWRRPLLRFFIDYRPLIRALFPHAVGLARRMRIRGSGSRAASIL